MIHKTPIPFDKKAIKALRARIDKGEDIDDVIGQLIEKDVESFARLLSPKNKKERDTVKDVVTIYRIFNKVHK